MRNVYPKLTAALKENRPVGVLVIILNLIITKLNSLWFKNQIQCRGHVYIKNGARLHGGRAISVGNGFHAGRGLWMEAVFCHQGSKYSPKIKIGDNVALSDWVHIGAIGELLIGNDVLIGSKVLVTDHNHGDSSDHQLGPKIPPSKWPLRYKQTRIGNNVWIGDNALILAGSDIGSNVIIGAGAVINTIIPSGSVVVGVNKIIKKAG
jgi:lipopolysaccharide O-acetyltransferase